MKRLLMITFICVFIALLFIVCSDAAPTKVTNVVVCDFDSSRTVGADAIVMSDLGKQQIHTAEDTGFSDYVLTSGEVTVESDASYAAIEFELPIISVDNISTEPSVIEVSGDVIIPLRDSSTLIIRNLELNGCSVMINNEVLQNGDSIVCSANAVSDVRISSGDKVYVQVYYE